MTNTTPEREKFVNKYNPKQEQWIQQKFGHLRPLIREAARVVEEKDKAPNKREFWK